MISVDLPANCECLDFGCMVPTHSGPRSFGWDPGISFRDPRTCLVMVTLTWSYDMIWRNMMEKYPTTTWKCIVIGSFPCTWHMRLVFQFVSLILLSGMSAMDSDRKEFENMVSIMCRKMAHIIVESRLGKKIHTPCKVHADVPDWVREHDQHIHSCGAPCWNWCQIIGMLLCFVNSARAGADNTHHKLMQCYPRSFDVFF